MRALLIQPNSDHGLIRQHDVQRHMAHEVVVQRAPSIAEGKELLTEAEWDVILLELADSERRALSFFDQIFESAQGVPIIVVVFEKSVELALQLVQLGAQDYLTQTEWRKGLFPHILQCAMKRAHPTDGPDRSANARSRPGRVSQLTDRLSQRENDVLDGMLGSKSIKEIAHHLGTKYTTVQKQRLRVLRKLEVESEVELIRVLLDESSVDLPQLPNQQSKFDANEDG